MKNKVKMTATYARTTMEKVFSAMVSKIIEYLDKNRSMKFKESVNLSFADEEMRKLAKCDNCYLLLTIDNQTGTDVRYDIEDPSYLQFKT